MSESTVPCPTCKEPAYYIQWGQGRVKIHVSTDEFQCPEESK